MLPLKIMLHLDYAKQKLAGKLIENTEDLNTVKPMYNLLEYSQNYYRDEIDDVGDNASDGKSCKYKTKVIENTAERPNWSVKNKQEVKSLSKCQKMMIIQHEIYYIICIIKTIINLLIQIY